MKNKMKFDYSKLRGRIVEKCGTYKHFADEINMNPSLISNKLNNKTLFTSDEIVKIQKKLDIDASEINIYFFAEDEAKTQYERVYQC